MKNFIARMGYTATWAFGIPEYSLEEKLEDYYKFGLSIIIVGILAMVFLIVFMVLILKKSDEVDEE